MRFFRESVAIPAWTGQGVLPPVGGADALSFERSPYIVRLTDYVLRFGVTPERQAILDGLFRYRAALHEVGFLSGFQWLDGSFLEQVEQTEGRPPNDIDVVTFFRLPPGISQEALAIKAGALLDGDKVRSAFHVDGYFVHLGMDAERLTWQSAYWYGVWSHRRNQLWKGFVQVDLAPTEDESAAATLASLSSIGERP